MTLTLTLYIKSITRGPSKFSLIQIIANKRKSSIKKEQVVFRLILFNSFFQFFQSFQFLYSIIFTPFTKKKISPSIVLLPSSPPFVYLYNMIQLMIVCLFVVMIICFFFVVSMNETFVVSRRQSIKR